MSIIIKHEGDTWRIISEGATKDGQVFCHLASTTRGKEQKNGFYPIQMCDWIDQKIILAGAISKEEEQRKAHHAGKQNQ